MEGVPRMFLRDYKIFIVLSGSMESEIFPGDLAIVKDIGTEELK